LVEPYKGHLSNSIEVGMVAPDQLDEDRFLGIEVVIETSGRMPAASAICWSEVRRPEVAMTAFAVFRTWVRRVASGFAPVTAVAELRLAVRSAIAFGPITPRG
jgi:hypothetical protein